MLSKSQHQEDMHIQILTPCTKLSLPLRQAEKSSFQMWAQGTFLSPRHHLIMEGKSYFMILSVDLIWFASCLAVQRAESGEEWALVFYSHRNKTRVALIAQKTPMISRKLFRLLTWLLVTWPGGSQGQGSVLLIEGISFGYLNLGL